MIPASYAISTHQDRDVTARHEPCRLPADEPRRGLEESRTRSDLPIKAGSGLGLRGLAKIARELPGYETSIRLIYGEKDRVLPDVAKTMARLQRAHPEAELTALPNCGHFLQEDEPERVGHLIGEFLNTATPEP